jgi:hypothetical protein
MEAKPTGEDLANTPAIAGNRIVFLAWRALSARKTRMMCVEIKDGKAQESWRSTDTIGNRTQSVSIWDQCVYLTSDVFPVKTADDVKGQVNCFDLLTGAMLWTSTAPQTHSHLTGSSRITFFNDGGAYMVADGKLLLIDGSGHLTVSDVSAKGCTLISDTDVSPILAVANPPIGMPYATPPLLLNGRLYLRNHSKVACYDVSVAPAAP